MDFECYRARRAAWVTGRPAACAPQTMERRYMEHRYMKHRHYVERRRPRLHGPQALRGAQASSPAWFPGVPAWSSTPKQGVDMRIKVFNTLLTALLLLFSVHGMARTGPKTQAKELAKAGVALIKAGNYKEALKFLLQSKQKAPLPGINWNIARCYEMLNRPQDALPYFQAFLKEAKGTDMEPKARQKIALMKSLIRRQSAHLLFTVTPESALITVDGKAVTDPHDVLLGPGTHHIVVSAQGFETRQLDVVLKKGEKRPMRVVLKQPVGTLRVLANAAKARVMVDGRKAYKGALPATLALAPGTHHVLVRAGAAYQPLNRDVRIIAGKSVSLELQKPPVRAAKAPRRVLIRKPLPARRTSPIKAGLFWGGIGLAAAGAAFNVWGYLVWKHTVDNKPTMAEVNAAISGAKWRTYTAFALYAAGAASVITSFFVGHGRHPLGFAFAGTGDFAGVVFESKW